jgi:hypothetical protein
MAVRIDRDTIAPYSKSFIFLVGTVYGSLESFARTIVCKAATLSDSKEAKVKPVTLAGVILIVLGVIALAYQGITYTTHKKVLDVGPIQATKTEHNTIPLPPIFGGIALVGGIVLMMAGAKQS